MDVTEQLVTRAIEELGLDPERSWLVGDRLRDIEAADGLGARGILVRTGYGAGEDRAGRGDLIVMGGYGHGRLREWVLGGATRHALAEADVPVLMAH